MKTVVATLESISPYSQSRHYDVPRLERELGKDYEVRTWRHRMHVDNTGSVFIPPMAFKNALSESAKFMSIQVAGKGKATYTKHFEAGVLVTEPLKLNIKPDDVPGEWLFVPSDGRRGGGSRVDKCFPIIHSWSGQVTFYILDELITEKPFHQHLEAAGKFIGIGRFRPRNNGFYGRFSVKSISWS